MSSFRQFRSSGGRAFQRSLLGARNSGLSDVLSAECIYLTHSTSSGPYTSVSSTEPTIGGAAYDYTAVNAMSWDDAKDYAGNSGPNGISLQPLSIVGGVWNPPYCYSYNTSGGTKILLYSVVSDPTSPAVTDYHGSLPWSTMITNATNWLGVAAIFPASYWLASCDLYWVDWSGWPTGGISYRAYSQSSRARQRFNRNESAMMLEAELWLKAPILRNITFSSYLKTRFNTWLDIPLPSSTSMADTMKNGFWGRVRWITPETAAQFTTRTGLSITGAP